MADCLNALVSLKKKQRITDNFIECYDYTDGYWFFKRMDPVFSLDPLLREFQPFQISLPAAAYYPELLEHKSNE